MSYRNATAAIPNKWVLKALGISQAKKFSFKLVLFFDISQDSLGHAIAWLQQLGPKGPELPYNLYFYKAAYILQFYNAAEFLLFMGEYVILLGSQDIEQLLRHLQFFSEVTPQLPLRLAGCLLFSTFTGLWPAVEVVAAGEQFVKVSTSSVLSALYALLWLHSEGRGLFYIYRLLLKVLHFYSGFLFSCTLWPFLFNSLVVRPRVL